VAATILKDAASASIVAPDGFQQAPMCLHGLMPIISAASDRMRDRRFDRAAVHRHQRRAF
jgi:hypothetical protein